LTCNKEGIPNEDNDTEKEGLDVPIVPTDNISDLKYVLLQELRANGGDATTPAFVDCLSMLSEAYKKYPSTQIHTSTGTWATLSKPNFKECLGRHPSSGEYMYTLGRMSFDMFPRGDLKCSLRGSFNIVGSVENSLDNEGLILPSSLKLEDLQGIKTYNISIPFRIEDTNLHGIITSYGYMYPDPHIAGRYSVWFTRGILEHDLEHHEGGDLNQSTKEEWKNIFGDMRRTLSERAKVIAARLFLGVCSPEVMEDDGSMEYIFMKPIRAYCDVLYLDENLRIIRGNLGTIYVFYRIS